MNDFKMNKQGISEHIQTPEYVTSRDCKGFRSSYRTEVAVFQKTVEEDVKVKTSKYDKSAEGLEL